MSAIEEIRQALGLPLVDDASIRELFLDFVARMDMSSSYKPVLLLAILDQIDEHGRAGSTRWYRHSTRFTWAALNAGLAVERPGMRMTASRSPARTMRSERSCSGCRSGSSNRGISDIRQAGPILYPVSADTRRQLTPDDQAHDPRPLRASDLRL